MRRARPIDTSTTVSLFPFLAVLLCTMGALIVILVVVARQAKLRGIEVATAREDQSESNQAEQLKLDQQISELQAIRSAIHEGLEQDRLVLSHVEERMKFLRNELAKLKQSAQQLASQTSSDEALRQGDRQESARLKHLIVEAEEQLEESRREISARRPSYAIVPYEGTSQTRRRPLYIECRANEVVLQPEGVTLTGKDFEGPLGPANPLASALRSASQYLSSVQQTPERGSNVVPSMPYPLLLVRPQGIHAYYRVRKAIESWGTDFGYELIDDDWDVSFPTPNATLARVEYRAVEEARRRQVRLAQAAPSRFRSARESFAGFSRDAGGKAWRRPSSGDDGFSRSGSSDGSFSVSPFGAPSGSGSSSRFASTPPSESATPDVGASPPSASSETPQLGTTTPPDQSANPSTNQTANRASDQTSNDASRSATSDGTSGDRATGAASEQRRGSQETGGNASGNGPASIANQRGRDWALPEKGHSAVPISRPVQVVVRDDRVTILSDHPTRGGATGRGRAIAMEGQTAAAIDEFVSSLWEHIGTWGIAGKGMYWKPVLKLHVAPGGETRASDLKALLKRSGVEFPDSQPGDEP